MLLADSQHVPDEADRLEECISWAHEVKNVRVELVVIQSPSAVDTTEASSQTSDRLNRNWSVISKYHLVRYPFDEHEKDFQRMSRRVSGKSIGLCLGGGGARGLAHLGVIKALNEVGVSIDHVGGTSQGAFVGALLAKYPDDEDKLIEAARIMAQDMSSITEKLLDLTLPITSYFSGHRFNLGIKKVLVSKLRLNSIFLCPRNINGGLSTSQDANTLYPRPHHIFVPLYQQRARLKYKTFH